MASADLTPLIAIVGPTASGKTAAAIELAKALDGEIICADSRSIYKGMDIGTAKPTAEEQAQIPHHGLDLVSPGESFSVADFKQYAEEKIHQIRARGHTPFLVGGSGLYSDAVIFDFQFANKANIDTRKHLQNMTIGELHKYCIENNISLPENAQNKRYVIRAIERQNVSLERRSEPIPYCYIVGIATKPKELRERIVLRSEQLFENNVVEEAKILGKKYGWDTEAMTGNIYPLVHSYLRGAITDREMRERFITLDWKLAKRQMTWFRRNPYIEWCSRENVVEYIRSLIEIEH